MLQKHIDKIKNISLFKNINKDEITLMMECLKPKILNYKKNEFIVIPGSTFENVGIILEGEATVSKENTAGNRIIMTTLEEGDIFGEMLAFSGQKTWPATVQAQSDCTIFFLSREKIIGDCDRMCPWHRVMIRNFIEIVSVRALQLNKKVEYLSIKSIRGKITTYLLEQFKSAGNKNITLPLKRNELADFLNVSRPSMSREMSKMRDEGVIDFHLSAFRIIDFEALKHMADS